MSSINCNFENGFKLCKNNNSYNKKDKQALIFLYIIFLFITISILYICTRYNIFLILMLTLLFYIIYRIYKNPIIMLYIPSYLISRTVRTPEFLNVDVFFPNHSKLDNKKTFEILQNELHNMLYKTNNGSDLNQTKYSYNKQNTEIGSDEIINPFTNKTHSWRLMNIKIGSTISNDGQKYFPTLVKILEELPEVKSCVVSVLEPGVRIPIHVGYYKGVMRYMLPLKIPKDRKNVFLCVNGIKYMWTEGVSVLWDDTFPHKVYNNTDEIRVVIYMDIIRPLNGFINKINNTFINLAVNSRIVKDEIKKSEIKIRIT